jgi:hypothetical protein
MGAITSREGHRIETEEKEGFLYITLHLKGSRKGRNIGRVRLADRTLEIVRNREKHLMKKGRAYGFNEYVIRHAKTFDTIELQDDYGTYVFPRLMVLDKGSYLHFKDEGFEKQLFLPLFLIQSFKLQSETL